MTSTQRLFLTVVAAGALAACGTTPEPAPQLVSTAAPAPAAPAPAPAPAAAPAARPSTVAPTPATPSAALPAHRDPTSAISRERIVYFDFDSSLLDAGDQALVDRHARYIVTQPGLNLRIEGHADERGSSEYNLALGQRRAEAVRRALGLLGVEVGRVEAVSFGEERPQVDGHDESAWSKNRRAEFVYPQR